MLPTLWFRNTWSWGGTGRARGRCWDSSTTATPSPRRIPCWASATSIADGAPALLFTENETNTERIAGVPNRTPYVKDAFDAYIVHGRRDAVNPARAGRRRPRTTS